MNDKEMDLFCEVRDLLSELVAQVKTVRAVLQLRTNPSAMEPDPWESIADGLAAALTSTGLRPALGALRADRTEALARYNAVKGRHR